MKPGQVYNNSRNFFVHKTHELDRFDDKSVIEVCSTVLVLEQEQQEFCTYKVLTPTGKIGWMFAKTKS